jgi:hypothetical protein
MKVVRYRPSAARLSHSALALGGLALGIALMPTPAAAQFVCSSIGGGGAGAVAVPARGFEL